MATTDIAIVLGTVEHALWLGPNLRAGDVAEAAAWGVDATRALVDSVVASEVCFSTFFNGELAYMFGAHTTANTLLARKGLLWMLSGHAVSRHPKAFLRSTRSLIDEMHLHWDVLYNYIDARYTGALRWAEWLGLQLEAPAPMGPHGMAFCRFSTRR